VKIITAASVKIRKCDNHDSSSALGYGLRSAKCGGTLLWLSTSGLCGLVKPLCYRDNMTVFRKRCGSVLRPLSHLKAALSPLCIDSFGETMKLSRLIHGLLKATCLTGNGVKYFRLLTARAGSIRPFQHHITIVDTSTSLRPLVTVEGRRREIFCGICLTRWKELLISCYPRPGWKMPRRRRQPSS